MGGLSCPIVSCPLYKRGSCKSSTEHVKIHRFPATNNKTRERWEEFVSKQNGTPFKSNKSHGLCSAHFGARWIMPSGRITRDAVPTIAPVSTKKVLCKWDLESSRLIPVETSTTESPEPLEEVISEDIQQMDCNESVEGHLSSGETTEADIAAVPFSELTGDILRGSAPSIPESLNTIEDVENAIRNEKKLAIMRYQASMRKVQSLEELLTNMKKIANTCPDSSTSCSLPVSSPTATIVTMSHISKLSPAGSPKVFSKSLYTSSNAQFIKSPSKIPNLVPPLVGPTSMGDNDLPPPLFDDYN